MTESGSGARSPVSEARYRRDRRATLPPLAALALLMMTACASVAPPAEPLPASATATPDVIEIHRSGLHPEDVEWDAERERFLVSSITTGSISAVDDNGATTVLSEGEAPVGTVGLATDRERGRLLVAEVDFRALADQSLPGVARLAIHDLASGELTSRIDLGTLLPGRRHGANDVAVASDGTAYVTDGFAPVIYAVDPQGNASVFMDDPRLGTPDGAGLNGIAVHPDGYLIVSLFSGDTLLRVPLDPAQEISKVAVPEPVLGDGLDFDADDNLVVAAPFAPTILVLTSVDGWASADVTERVDTVLADSTTNTAFRDGEVYAVNAHFDEIGAPEPRPVFEIFRTQLNRDAQ